MIIKCVKHKAKAILFFGMISFSFSAQATDEFAFGGLKSSCFSYPAVAMTPYDGSADKYHATHTRVYHKGRKTGSILLYGPVQSWETYGDGFTFTATFRDPDGAGKRSQVIAQLRFIGNDGIRIIKTLKSNDSALATSDIQTMSSPLEWDEIKRNDGYYVVRMYVQRSDATLKPAAFGYNLCSSIF
jgi:hypothetical protein